MKDWSAPTLFLIERFCHLQRLTTQHQMLILFNALICLFGPGERKGGPLQHSFIYEAQPVSKPDRLLDHIVIKLNVA